MFKVSPNGQSHTVGPTVSDTIWATSLEGVMSIHISLAEASRRANVSPTSIRRWITSGKINAKKTENDEWVIDSTELHLLLIKQSGKHVSHTVSDGSNSKRKGGTTVSPTVGDTVGDTVVGRLGLSEALKEARQALSREREINDELRSHLRELEKERTQHLAEMRAILSKDSQSKEGIISRWIRR